MVLRQPDKQGMHNKHPGHVNTKSTSMVKSKVPQSNGEEWMRLRGINSRVTATKK